MRWLGTKLRTLPPPRQTKPPTDLACRACEKLPNAMAVSWKPPLTRDALNSSSASPSKECGGVLKKALSFPPISCYNVSTNPETSEMIDMNSREEWNMADNKRRNPWSGSPPPALAEAFIQEQVAALQKQIGDKKVLLAPVRQEWTPRWWPPCSSRRWASSSPASM